MLNDFETIDAQSDLASLAQVAANEAANELDQAVHEIVFEAQQFAIGNI
jgi:hypothetical protein